MNTGNGLPDWSSSKVYVHGPGGASTGALDQTNVGRGVSSVTPAGTLGDTSTSHCGTARGPTVADVTVVPSLPCAVARQNTASPLGSAR